MSSPPDPANSCVAEPIAAICGPRTFRVMDIDMTSAEHVFLSRAQVRDRYRWSDRTASRRLAAADFPRHIGGRWRLDTLQAWEARELSRVATRASRTPKVVAPIRALSGPAPTIPAKKSRGRKAA